MMMQAIRIPWVSYLQINRKNKIIALIPIDNLGKT